VFILQAGIDYRAVTATARAIMRPLPLCLTQHAPDLALSNLKSINTTHYAPETRCDWELMTLPRPPGRRLNLLRFCPGIPKTKSRLRSIVSSACGFYSYNTQLLQYSIVTAAGAPVKLALIASISPSATIQ